MRRHTAIFLMVLLLVGGAGLVPSVSTACCGGKCDVCRASLLWVLCLHVAVPTARSASTGLRRFGVPGKRISCFRIELRLSLLVVPVLWAEEARTVIIVHLIFPGQYCYESHLSRWDTFKHKSCRNLMKHLTCHQCQTDAGALHPSVFPMKFATYFNNILHLGGENKLRKRTSFFLKYTSEEFSLYHYHQIQNCGLEWTVNGSFLNTGQTFLISVPSSSVVCSKRQKVNLRWQRRRTRENCNSLVSMGKTDQHARVSLCFPVGHLKANRYLQESLQIFPCRSDEAQVVIRKEIFVWRIN